jgi:acyl carrier protein
MNFAAIGYQMRIKELEIEVERLRNAIRLHRDERGHDRCWLDDARLYSVLPEGKKADMVLPCREEFLENCARYWANRQEGKMSDVFGKIAEILKEELGVAEVRAAQSLADLGADSLDAVEVMMAVEEEFNVSIPDAEFDQIKTIGDLVSIVEKKIQN